jgi:hypothetical protein
MQKRASVGRSATHALIALALAAGPALAEKKYGPGVTDTEIKVGQTMAYSGPFSFYGTVGRVEAAYFNKINAEGGINGRKITLQSVCPMQALGVHPRVRKPRELSRDRNPKALVTVRRRDPPVTAGSWSAWGEAQVSQRRREMNSFKKTENTEARIWRFARRCRAVLAQAQRPRQCESLVRKPDNNTKVALAISGFDLVK